MKEKLKMKWQKLKAWILAKLAGINRECLATLLIACAIATAVALAIVIAIKLPILQPTLALIGLVMVMVVWPRLPLKRLNPTCIGKRCGERISPEFI